MADPRESRETVHPKSRGWLKTLCDSKAGESGLWSRKSRLLAARPSHTTARTRNPQRSKRPTASQKGSYIWSPDNLLQGNWAYGNLSWLNSPRTIITSIDCASGSSLALFKGKQMGVDVADVHKTNQCTLRRRKKAMV